MHPKSVLTQDDFNSLLGWFSPNRDEAALKYEEIRNGLIRFFYLKGCSDPEDLADETINRVAKKYSTFDINNTNKHSTYFYGFASKIYLEYRRNIQKRGVPFEPDLHSNLQVVQNSDDLLENSHKCLDKCLATLSPDDRHLIVEYFCEEKKEKLILRRQLAEKMNLRKETLYVRICRLKNILRNCLEKCLQETSM